MVTGQNGVEYCGHAEVKRGVTGLNLDQFGHPNAICILEMEQSPSKHAPTPLFTEEAALTANSEVNANIRSCGHISSPFPTPSPLSPNSTLEVDGRVTHEAVWMERGLPHYVDWQCPASRCLVNPSESSQTSD